MDEPQRLGCRSLFAIISDAVFQDGVVEPHEQQLLNKIAAFLKLPPKTAMAIAKRSKERFDRGELGPATPINGEAVYERSLRLACADGTVDTKERTLLEAMRKLFKIKSDTHNELMKKIRAELSGQQPSAPEPPTPQPAPVATPQNTQAQIAAQAAPILAALQNDATACAPTEQELRGPRKERANKRFYLEAGGLPIPFILNIGLAGIASVIFLCGFFLVGQMFDRDQLYDKRRDRHKGKFWSPRAERYEIKKKKTYRKIHDGILFVFVFAGITVYMMARRKYENKLLEDGNTIIVSEGSLSLPAFITGDKVSRALTKADIERIYLGISESGGVTSINFALKGSARITRIGASCLNDANQLANTINDYMGIPFGKENQSFFDDHGETMIAGGVFLVVGGFVLTMLFF